MIYLSNAFSLQMQGNSFCQTRPVTLDEVRIAVSPYRQGNTESKSKYWGTGPMHFPAKSVIGHGDICSIINSQLGLEGESVYSTNREAVQLTSRDVLYVGQYIGPRLAEGTTLLPEGAIISWYRVDCVGRDPSIAMGKADKLYWSVVEFLEHSDLAMFHEKVFGVYPDLQDARL
jgi:hypothetical protein